MRRLFQTFVDGLTESRDSESLRQSMAEIAAALDLCCFAYLSLPHDPKAEPLLISTYPSRWTAHYLRHHYERFDPVVVRALRDPQPFEWGLGIGPATHSELESELFEEAARFGIRHGFTIPVHDSRGAVAAVTFAADDQRPRFKRSIYLHEQILQLMAMYFHAHARRKLVTDELINGSRLSPREIECLKWAAQGKSAWETGRILGISRHTVAFHLDNAKAKLGVRSNIQAVARLTASKPDI
ncbi:LuxR family transcriptional regulator [Bradyrhizobium diazoefficiens]|nr:LuxR family transcriptional regulator [Bradyrhizobium diazoefficiens]QQO20597.1 LuxR family transcriptional regulator [Bradyrhizobium diazoefficiens]